MLLDAEKGSEGIELKCVRRALHFEIPKTLSVYKLPASRGPTRWAQSIDMFEILCSQNLFARRGCFAFLMVSFVLFSFARGVSRLIKAHPPGGPPRVLRLTRAGGRARRVIRDDRATDVQLRGQRCPEPAPAVLGGSDDGFLSSRQKRGGRLPLHLPPPCADRIYSRAFVFFVYLLPLAACDHFGTVTTPTAPVGRPESSV